MDALVYGFAFAIKIILWLAGAFLAFAAFLGVVFLVISAALIIWDGWIWLRKRKLLSAKKADG